MNSLIDSFGRQITYLRLSVTDRCDFRCVYCMAEEMTFLPRSEILTLEELYLVAQAFTELGTQRIRITGGEPLVRKDITSALAKISQLPNLRELNLTTNGSQLKRMAPQLRRAGLSRINISLDSLNPQQFSELTRCGKLQDVLDGIQAVKRAGFTNTKINCVILKGRNDNAILPLVDFVVSEGLNLSFIEEMPLGHIEEHDRGVCFMPSSEIRALIGTRYQLQPTTASEAGPSRYESVVGSNTRIGFISPHSENFCHLCNRVRVTADGRLLLCLGNEHSADLKPALRNTADPLMVLKQTIREAIQRKPERHHFQHDNEPQIVRFMNMTGG